MKCKISFILKGNHSAKNFAIREAKILPPYLPGGEKWKFEVKFFKGLEQVGGYVVYATITKDI